MSVQPKLSVLADACLFKLYRLAIEGTQQTGRDELSALFEGKASTPVIKLAIEILVNSQKAKSIISQSITQYSISGSGYLLVEAFLEEKSFYSIYSEKGDDWLFETGGVIDDEEADSSSSTEIEDAWEPLPLDRQNPALAQAIEKIDELIQAITQDNGYAANEPDERNYILSALRSGAQALRDQTVIYRMQFMGFIWEPIQRIATRFGPSAIGVLADAAKESIKEWLKSAAKNFLDN